MRIVELAAIKARIPLKREIKHASHARSVNETLLVRCTLSDGTVGWGEGLPREYVTGETFDDAWRLFRETDWAAQLDEFADFSRAIVIAERLQLPPAPAMQRECFGNSLRCAVELSMLDAAARSFGHPLSDAVQIAAPDLFGFRNACRYSAVLPHIRKPRKQRMLSLGIRVFGFTAAKVKVAIDGQDDIATLARIRKWAGGKISLRIDANEAWTPEETADRLRSFSEFDLESCEQPVPHDQIGQLASIRNEISTPLMLDESLCSLEDADRAIDQGYADLFNIRLSKCGGLLPSLRIAQRAQQAGLGYQLGCQVGETGILSAAGRHFACAVKDIRWLEGSFDRWLVRERLTRQNLTFKSGGRAKALTQPGLGVDIDEKAIKRVWEDEVSVSFR